VVAGADGAELLRGEVVELALRRERGLADRVEHGWSTGSLFLRPTPKLIRSKISSMIAGAVRRCRRRRFVRTALLPHAMS
jgi:hypothetical protein